MTQKLAPFSLLCIGAAHAESCGPWAFLAQRQHPQKGENEPQKTGKHALGPNTHKGKVEDLLAQGQDPQKEEKGPQKTGKHALGPSTHKGKVEDLLAQGQHPQKAEKEQQNP